MRFKFALIAFLLLGTAPVAAQELTTDEAKLSYSIGWRFGVQIREEGFDVDTLVRAITEAAAGQDPAMDVAEIRQQLAAWEEKVRQEQIAALQQLAEENQAKAETFLEENKGKTGIVVLPSGVQYRIIEEGDGGRPGLEDKVSVHYRSSKVEGIELDSSFARGVPQEFVVNEVLQGWQEVLPLMKVGSTWQIFVPPELAFGQRGNPPAVGPNEALMFDLKLMAIIDG